MIERPSLIHETNEGLDVAPHTETIDSPAVDTIAEGSAVKIERIKNEMHVEISRAFEEFGIPLNSSFIFCFNEPNELQNVSDGSGYTTAFRELAEFINEPDRKLAIFDMNSIRKEFSDSEYTGEKACEYIKERLIRVEGKLTHPAHQLFVGMIHDLMFGSENDINTISTVERVAEVGTCVAAEKYFLNYTSPRYRERKGKDSMRIITQNESPIMLEKIELGEKSCLTLVPLKIGQVEIPAGSLLQAVEKDEPNITERTEGWISSSADVGEYIGFRFLRISTLSLPPELREEAFGYHYTYQKAHSDRAFTNYDWITPEKILELVKRL